MPLVEVPPIAAPEPSPGRNLGFGGALVVCIDNDAAIVAGMEALLTGWQCDVIGAKSASQALALIGERTPDAFIVDYHLDGGTTGLATLDELASRFGGPIPAVVITADHTEGVRQAIESRGCEVLYKPVRPGSLRALLARLVRATPRHLTPAAAADRREVGLRR